MSLDRLSLMQSKHNRNNTLADREQSWGKKRKLKEIWDKNGFPEKNREKWKCVEIGKPKKKFLRPRYKFGVKKVWVCTLFISIHITKSTFFCAFMFMDGQNFLMLFKLKI